MKVNTVEQYKVMEYIKNNFYIEDIELTLKDRYTIRVKDCNGDEMDFYYYEGKVLYKDVEKISRSKEEEKRIKYLYEQLEKLELIEEPTEQDKIAFDVVCKELREKHKLEHISHKLYCELD